jgi:hypothetical protein
MLICRNWQLPPYFHVLLTRLFVLPKNINLFRLKRAFFPLRDEQNLHSGKNLGCTTVISTRGLSEQSREFHVRQHSLYLTEFRYVALSFFSRIFSLGTRV